jgi:uncharacterized protein (DUF362 family)
MHAALNSAVERIGGWDRFVGRNDRVLLKPNLNGDGCTNRDLVEALIRLLLDHSVKQIVIAESTFGDKNTTDMFFRKSGYAALAARYGIELLNLNASEAVDVPVAGGLVLDKVRIAREVFEADKIINLPNMKVHYATGVSLSLKNLKGLLVGDEKKRFHEVGLDKAIVDLNRVVKVHLNIIDCISCMERMGPHGGDKLQLNLLLAGEHPAEVDYVGIQVMGYRLDEVGHLERYLEAHCVDPSRIEIVGEPIDAVRHPFQKVAMANIIPEGFRVHNRNACSSCMNAFLLSCRFIEESPREPIDVYLGSMVEGDVAEGMTIAFGNCCPGHVARDHRIQGCPPYPFLLRDRLKEQP